MPMIAAASLISLSACASYDKQHVDYADSSAYVSTVTVEGITLSAEPYDTEAEVVSAFDEPLNEKGYYPIRVHLNNGSQDRIIVLRETVELESPKGQTFRPVGAAVMADDFEDDAVAYALLGFGIFSYASAKDANKEREADYHAKEIPESRIIAPGSSLGAFVYFQLPEGVDINSCTLRGTVEHMDGGGVTSFELPFGQRSS
ncbi:MAG: hypothetical protein GY791_06380 [Alphaproteobacteria bacterium]|nr:hypothetical protein [Alphaproteobacteria bacterium]